MIRLLDTGPFWLYIDPRLEKEDQESEYRQVGFVPNHGTVRWTWDGNTESPTISPSVRHTGDGINHYFIQNGKILYCADSTHSYAGQTLDLPTFTDAEIVHYTEIYGAID